MRSNLLDGVTDRLTAAEQAIDALVESVRAEGLRRESHEELSGVLIGARRLQARLESVVLATVREVDVRGSHVEDGALTAAAWARMHARMTPHEAASAQRTARALDSGELPGTAAALAAGQIDAAHVRAIADAVVGAPAGAAALIEEEALAVAREADSRAVAALMRRFRDALDPDAADASAVGRYERRGLTITPLPDGTVHVTGRGDEVDGALLATAIDAASPPVTGDRRSPAQRRWDALTDICRRFLASPNAPMVGGGHAHVIVTVDHATVSDDVAPVRRHDTPGGPAASPGGTLSWMGPITGATAQRVACDAELTVVIIDEHGRVTQEERRRRFFTPAQRRAMIARDGDRCVVPYCDRPITWADAHHLIPVSHGGPTTVEHGALPCAAHHVLLHEGRWRLERLSDGRYLMHHPDGKVIGPESHPPGHNRPPPRCPRE